MTSALPGVAGLRDIVARVLEERGFTLVDDPAADFGELEGRLVRDAVVMDASGATETAYGVTVKRDGIFTRVLFTEKRRADAEKNGGGADGVAKFVGELLDGFLRRDALLALRGTKAEVDRLRANVDGVRVQVDALRSDKEAVYRERNLCVALIARLADKLNRVAFMADGFGAWLGRHDETDASWDRDWLNIVFVQLPTGQLSWHIHDDELPLFAFLPRAQDMEPGTFPAWDGHTTEEKYDRLRAALKEGGLG